MVSYPTPRTSKTKRIVYLYLTCYLFIVFFNFIFIFIRGLLTCLLFSQNAISPETACSIARCFTTDPVNFPCEKRVDIDLV